jgi:ATP phosphoribosyltransferase regulatory subunit
MTNRWLLPENIADVLPGQSNLVESLRRDILNLFQSYGYELVIPPMLEYIESLMTATGSDMDLQTFKLVDQLSGRTLGLRADMTTQVARIDAHILNRKNIVRLCYAGTTLQTRVVPGIFSREQLQVGAEVYGHQGIEADIEIVNLMIQSLEIAQVGPITLDVSHAGLLKDILDKKQLSSDDISEMYRFLQAKDRTSLQKLMQSWDQNAKNTILSVLDLSGDAHHVLSQAQIKLPQSEVSQKVLKDLEQLYSGIKKTSAEIQLNIDLADLDGFQYHTGILCAAYVPQYPVAIARGGRYDQVGQVFGRSRPATGFSVDLLALAGLSTKKITTHAIMSPWDDSDELRQVVSLLRNQGEIVIESFPGHEHNESTMICDRCLEFKDQKWQVVPKN